MTAHATISLSTIICACLAVRGAVAFSAGGTARAISRAPVATKPEWQSGVEIELPDMELLFDRIGGASPLAKLVMEGNAGGFEAIDDSATHPELKWKKVEANERRTVHRIDKADKYQGLNIPLLRFRSSIQGPLIGELFSNFIMDLDERKKWDDQVAKVEEMYPIEVGPVNTLLCEHDKDFGTCTKLGVGYTQTKQGIISPREQLTLAGMHRFDSGATILWGTELEESQNHLLPDGQRHTRAKSHLFAATLAPTGPDSFDVEYLLQMEVGGGLPHFMTTPALTDTVKKMFEHAKTYFGGGEGSELDMYLKAKQQEQYAEIEALSMDAEFLDEVDLTQAHSHHHVMNDNESLLFTP